MPRQSPPYRGGKFVTAIVMAIAAVYIIVSSNAYLEPNRQSGVRTITAFTTTKFLSRPVEDDAGMPPSTLAVAAAVSKYVAETTEPPTPVPVTAAPTPAPIPLTPEELEIRLEAIPPLPADRPILQGGPQTPHLDQHLNQFFGHTSNLFFIESGAFNGISHSNTLWLERNQHWTGLLVEANPNMAALVRTSGRVNSKLWEGCLSVSGHPGRVQFQLANALGGIVDEMDDRHKARIQQEIRDGKSWMKEDRVGQTVSVICQPLNTLLSQMNIRQVDFWSLDTEGSELSILKTVDFEAVQFGLLFIESNTQEHRNSVRAFMTSKGFVENQALKGAQDTAWQNPKYCAKYTDRCHL